MESFDLKIKVFKNTPGDKRTLHNIIEEFIHSNDNNSEIAVVRTVGKVGAPFLKEFFNNLGFHVECNASAKENLSRKDLLDRTGNTMSTSSPAVMPEITFRLYNCDHTYNLDRVEALITKVTTKLSLKAKIEQKYFSLPQMSELCVKLEDEGKQPGYAVFVVHAHESSLVINTNNLYAGYSMLYRTLLRLTDDRVLIVIGGDDNYKDQEERDKKVLSRKMWSKICSQFNNKYISGEKSFIFSWDENYHPIHEEALEFYLDPKKKGQEFVPKTYPPVPKDDEKGKDFPDSTVQQPDVETIPEKTMEGEAAPKTPDFHVLSFNSQKTSVSTVEKLLEDVYKQINFTSKPCSPYLIPNDFPKHIKDSKPDYVVLVFDGHDVKSINYLDSWVQLYKEILETIAIVDKNLIIAVCGDTEYKDDTLVSGSVQDQLSQLNPGILSSSKVKMISWNTKPCAVHQDALRQLLVPQKTKIRKPKSRKQPRSLIRPDESKVKAEQAEAETDIEKGRLRYRALIRRGRIFEVQKSDPPGWEPEETMVKHLLDKHKNLFRGFLEFWESKDGKMTAVVITEDTPLSFYKKLLLPYELQ